MQDGDELQQKKSGAASVRMQPLQNIPSMFFLVYLFYTIGYYLAITTGTTSHIMKSYNTEENQVCFYNHSCLLRITYLAYTH